MDMDQRLVRCGDHDIIVGDPVHGKIVRDPTHRKIVKEARRSGTRVV